VRTEDIKADLLHRADGTLSAFEAARMLGTDVVTLQELAAESAVIALPLPGGTAYPAGQFEIGSLVAARPGCASSGLSPRILLSLVPRRSKPCGGATSRK
jgi:hypothetical protein